MKTTSLVLTRRPSESLQFAVESPDGSTTHFSVTLDELKNQGNQARIRIDAPMNVSISRTELLNDSKRQA